MNCLRLLTAIVLLPFFAEQSFAMQGGVVSGGGDAISEEFTKIGYDVLKRLSIEPLTGVENSKLLAALKTVRVISKTSLLLNGAPVDAINTPAQKTIQVSRTRWNNLANKPKEKFLLVAHEYFSVSGLNDQRYQFSHQLFDNPGVPLLKYDCELYPKIEVFKNIHLKAYLYQNFANLSFYDINSGESVSDVDALYSVALDSFNPSTLDNMMSILVSISWGVMTQMISLPYSASNASDWVKIGTHLPMISKTIDSLVDPDPGIQNSVFCDVQKF